jgi:cyclic pyranopterin monophosphate synthase
MTESPKDPTAQPFSHLDASGDAQMVNVGSKQISVRQASATASCLMKASTADAIRADQIGKGNVLQVARLAAISAAKRTDELIPLCHSIGLDSVTVEFNWPNPQHLRIVVLTQATARTGVEMEALVAASIAALTVYDMCKSIDREMQITQVEVLSKSGGSRGDFQRSDT